MTPGLWVTHSSPGSNSHPLFLCPARAHVTRPLHWLLWDEVSQPAGQGVRQGLLSCSLWVTAEWAASILPETRRPELMRGRPSPPRGPGSLCPRSRRWFLVPPSPSPTSVLSKQNLIRISSVHAGHCWILTHKSAKNRINMESGQSNRRERGPGLCSGPPDRWPVHSGWHPCALLFKQVNAGSAVTCDHSP